MSFVAGVINRYLLLLILVGLLNACSHAPVKDSTSTPSSRPPPASPGSPDQRYPGKDKDWGPADEIDMSQVPDAAPRYELRTIAGNKNPYTILGKTYYLLDDERAYKERGKASWYGYKFNGERTSNGELYNMFSMTAAHKTLPIPSYVRVTNLVNHNSVIVRINDRGPFHDERIIDLSYAAAQRLGITQVGTGDVEVEIMVPDDDPRPPLRPRKKGAAHAKEIAAVKDTAPVKATSVDNNVPMTNDGAVAPAVAALPQGTYLQIAAFAVEKSAQQFAASVGGKLAYPIVISAVTTPNNLFRVRVGPFKDSQTLQNARDQLQLLNILQSHVVYQ